MKRYILKKDLPTFNKGETFYLNEQGNLVQEVSGVVAYASSTLAKFNILDSDWFEEAPEENKRWRAGIGEHYWYLDSNGEAYITTEREDDIDDARFSIGDYFKTEEEAQKARDWLKAFTVLRDDTKGFTPNWKDEAEDKYFVIYDHPTDELWVDSDFRYQKNLIYFRSREDAEASIEKHKKEWLTYLGVEDEEENEKISN